MVLLFIIGAILVLTFGIKVTDIDIKKQLSGKEIEFTDITLIEVDMESMQSIAHSRYGVGINGVLMLDELNYHSGNLELLRAKKGIYHDDKIFLDGDVFVRQKEGFEYRTQYAVYDKATEILDVTSPFIAKMNQNTIQGDSMRYNLRQKEVSGKGIAAVVYTTEK
ncbi:MAG: hypothetical protein QG564_776 [Campylobacterota bacterium]|nr:hypothetical protein [Campylobacterota bacterium]